MSLCVLRPCCLYRDKFRCCTPRDEPDTCTHNSTYGGYDYEQRRKDQDSFMGVLTDDHAAVCKYAVLVDESCPSFLSTGTTCEVLQMNWCAGQGAVGGDRRAQQLPQDG